MRMHSFDDVELVALATLGMVAAYLGVSDWKRCTVDLQAVLACHCIAACVNAVIIFGAVLTRPDDGISWQISSTTLEGTGETAMETIRNAAGSILTLIYLSDTTFAFHRLGLLAAGDALVVPALLAMLMLVAQPVEIIVYFVFALVTVLAICVVRNVRNNLSFRHTAYGPLWHRLYSYCSVITETRWIAGMHSAIQAIHGATTTASSTMKKRENLASPRNPVAFRVCAGHSGFVLDLMGLLS